MITSDFIYAGNAIFTVSNPTGEHYTYRVTKPDNQDVNKPIWFVSFLSGPDNTSDYSYLGLLSRKDDGSWSFFATKASKAKPDSKVFKVAGWALTIVLEEQPLPTGYKIQHAGRCGRCGRPLTDPESIATGLGPICRDL